MSEKNLVLLSASPYAEQAVEGNGVQGEEDGGGIRCMGETPQQKMEGLILGGDKRRNVSIGNKLVYYIISRAFIGIPDIFVSYGFPQYLT